MPPEVIFFPGASRRVVPSLRSQKKIIIIITSGNQGMQDVVCFQPVYEVWPLKFKLLKSIC